MGKRGRARGRVAKPTAPESEYSSPQGDLLVLRGALTPKTRRQYDDVLRGNVLSQEDAWQRATELLFERLAVRWVVADVPTEGQRELLMRFRVATPDERAGSATSCVSTSPSTSPSSRRREPGPRPPPSRTCWPATASTSSPARPCSCARPRWRETLSCSSSSARSWSARRGRCCASSCRDSTRAHHAHARDLHLDDYPDLALTEAKKIDALLGIQAPSDVRELDRRRPRPGSRAMPARGARSARRR